MTNLIQYILFFGISTIIVVTIVSQFRREFIVQDGTVALLYKAGKLINTLEAGRHVRWGRHLTRKIVDIRKTLLVVAGQEVLTSDNVAVKISAVLATQIVDAIKSTQNADNHAAHIYSATQTALRIAVAGTTLENLLSQRDALNANILAQVAPVADSVGVLVHSIALRDVMLPGDLRKAFADVLKAKQEGHAALERTRGETAALRNLANVARLVETSPGIATLRFLQMLESRGSGQTFMMNDISSLLPSLTSRGAKPSATEPGET